MTRYPAPMSQPFPTTPTGFTGSLRVDLRPDMRAEFAARFEDERARRLARRIKWLCFFGFFLETCSLIGSIFEFTDPANPPSRESWYQLWFDIVSVILIGLTLAYIMAARRTRTQVVWAATAFIVSLCASSVIFTPLLDNSNIIPNARPGVPGESAIAEWWVVILENIVLHVLGSLCISLAPKEGLRMLGAMVVFFTIGALADPNLPKLNALIQILVLILGGIPGFMWSWYRHRGFTDRFLARTLHEKFGELTTELAEARSVHEALFPPAVTRGPVRLHYRYEPMRDIGGDFLFCHPLSFPPSESARPLTMVLIDVTGHGVSSALAVNRLYAALHREFASPGDHPPSEIISSLNRLVFDTLAPQAMFATAICIRVDGVSGDLQWASAGHPPAMLLRSDRSVQRLESSATMLGVLAPDAFQTQDGRITMSRDDALLAFTDGAFEATNSRGQMLGLDGLQSSLQNAAQLRDKDGSLAAHIMSEVSLFRAGPTRDDILIVEMTLGESDTTAVTAS